MKLTKKQQLVYRAIQAVPECANDDSLLLATVWGLEGWNDNRDLYGNLKRLTRPETISRRRRELFNMNLINYTPAALETRTGAFESERSRHSNFTQARLGGIK